MLGLRVDEAGPELVRVSLTIDERHLQPLGLVHGGVFATMAETACSIGASLSARQRDPDAVCVGLENHTTFLRAARVGAVLELEARPRHPGRRTQSWSVSIREQGSDREVAMSTVRLMVVRPGEV